MSDNKNESVDSSVKPQLKSETLAINMKQLTEEWKQKRDNIDKNIEEDLEAMVRQSFEEMITDCKNAYHKYCEDESAFEERMARSVISRENSESDCNEMASLLEESKRLKDNVFNCMNDFERESRLNVDLIIDYINQCLLKTYTNEGLLHLRVGRLERVLSAIKGFENRASHLISTFDSIRSEIFANNSS